MYGAVLRARSRSPGSSTSCASWGRAETLLGFDLPDQAPQVFSVGVFAVILIVVILFFPRGLFPRSRTGSAR